MRALLINSFAAALVLATLGTAGIGAHAFSAAPPVPPVLWNQSTLQYSSAPAQLADGRIVTRTGPYCSGSGAIDFLNARTGNVDATYPFSSPPDPPAAAGNMVVFSIGCSESFGVIDTETGVNQTIPNPGVGWCYKPPVIVSGGAAAVFICQSGTASVQLSPLKIINYTSAWSTMRSKPVVAANGMLVSGTQGGTVFAAHPTSLQAYWRSAQSGSSVVCVTGNTVVVGSVGGASLVGLSLSTGAQLWSAGLPTAMNGADPVCVDGAAVFHTSGNVYKVSAATGSVVWSATVDTSPSISSQTSPVATSNAVYVYAGTSVFGIELSSGNLLWQLPNAGAHTNSFYNEGVSVAGEAVVVGVDSGVVAIQAHAATPAPTAAQTVTELVCSDDQCSLACTRFTVPMGCTEVSNGSGAAVSVRRSCSASAASLTIDTFDGTATCSASSSVARSTARYPLGSCVPLPTGGYLRASDCTAN